MLVLVVLLVLVRSGLGCVCLVVTLRCFDCILIVLVSVVYSLFVSYLINVPVVLVGLTGCWFLCLFLWFVFRLVVLLRWVVMVVDFGVLWMLFGLFMVRICFRSYVML